MKSRVTKIDQLPCGRPAPAEQEHHEREHLSLEEMTRRLEAFVAEKKLNRSEARARILDVIAVQSSHFSAQDLVERIQERFPEVGRSTVYRNLPIFVECGLIQEGPPNAEGMALYELTHSADDHHDHIVCLTATGSSNSTTTRWKSARTRPLRSSISTPAPTAT